MAGKSAEDKSSKQATGETGSQAKSGVTQGAASAAAQPQAGSNQSNGTPSAKFAQATRGAQGAAAQLGTSAADLIKQDHREVERMFDAFEKASNRNQKQRLVGQICFALTTHTLIEEELFYPACRDKVDDDQLDEAQVEHDGAKQLIIELRDGSPSDPFYDAKVKVLSEYVKHHVKEEEEPGEGILAAAEKAGVDMQALGREITERRAEFEDQARQERDPEMPSRESGGRRQGGRQQGRRQGGQPSRSQPSGGRQSGGYGGGQDRDDDRSSTGRERNEYGRFASDDNDARSSRGRGSRYEDDDDRGGHGHSHGEGRGGHGGWFGDPEGHADAARRGWGDRDDDDRGRSRSRDDDDHDDHSRGRSSRGRDDENDDRGGRGQGSRGSDNRGWHGDSRGHAEAARRGWSDR